MVLLLSYLFEDSLAFLLFVILISAFGFLLKPKSVKNQLPQLKVLRWQVPLFIEIPSNFQVVDYVVDVRYNGDEGALLELFDLGLSLKKSLIAAKE